MNPEALDLQEVMAMIEIGSIGLVESILFASLSLHALMYGLLLSQRRALDLHEVELVHLRKLLFREEEES